jgi:hypothetical protein
MLLELLSASVASENACTGGEVLLCAVKLRGTKIIFELRGRK